jgi:hypothetical protein
METTISKQQAVNASLKQQTTVTKTKARSAFWESAEFNRYGIIAMVLLIIGCMGGFAASYAGGNNAFKIALVAFPTILSLAFILAVMPMRLIIWASSIAVLIDMALLISYILSN